MSFKVVVAGGRKFNDYKMLEANLDNLLSKMEDIEIVSGVANGADKLGERYSKERGYKLKQFPADWNTHKYAAGPIRNKQMLDYCDAVIVFWDGVSRGSMNMINITKKANKPIRIIKY